MVFDKPDQYETIVAPRYEAIAAGLMLRMKPKAGEAVLEVGAGTGLLTRSLVLSQAVVTATDINLSMLNEASRSLKRLDLSAPPLLAADMANLPFRSHSFDLVAANLTPMQDSMTFLLEARRVLRMGGRLALSMWGSSYSELRVVNNARRAAGKGHVPYGAPRRATDRLRRLGFEVERTDCNFRVSHSNAGAYLAYQRAFGDPPGWNGGEVAAYFEAIERILTRRFGNKTVQLDWNVSYLVAVLPI
ncbi:class I SAM-dependent methyltransferase [Actinoplanes sp. NPDC049668]|uniref:class I SAM-dependent methyltransferase n=1 Tax=unclassified Actinoplanes TaxID=2626549 RepID=UPI0033A52757